MKINIAIDGPAGSGKSSIGLIIANKLNYNFIDTGLIYRAFTYYCIIKNINFNNINNIKNILKNFNYKIENNNIFLKNKNITDKLQSKLVLKNINKITNLEFVRKKIINFKKNDLLKKGIVMTGRDITTVILKNAELKFYLTANFKIRAKRRFYQENKNKNKFNFLFFLKKIKFFIDLKKRDNFDKNRTISPLYISNDAIIIDNSFLTFDETINKIYNLCLKKIKYLKTKEKNEK